MRFAVAPYIPLCGETSILFVTLIAVIFLKERLTLVRLAGIGAIAAGAAVLMASS